MTLTLAEANRAVEAAIAKAREFNVEITVAVCDAGGRLVAFNRMEGVLGWAASYGTIGKAVASAAFGRPGRELVERANTPVIRSIMAAEGGHMIIGPGSVPIIRGGIVKGACGIGAPTLQQEEDCAQAAADAV